MSTRLDAPTMRAKIVYDELRRRPEIERAEEIPALFPTSPRVLVDQAIDVLVARGSITEAADGRLCILRWQIGGRG